MWFSVNIIFRRQKHEIQREMVSRRRNEIIADLFHRIYFGEKWGRGISLILSKEPTADFKEVADIFITTFKRKNYDADSNDLDTSEKTGKKTNKKTSKKIEDQLVDLMRKNSRISVKDLSKLVELLMGGVRYHLESLKKKGILKRIGPDKGGYWEIKI